MFLEDYALLCLSSYLNFLANQMRILKDNYPLRALVCGFEHAGTTMVSEILRQHPLLDSGLEGGFLLNEAPIAFLTTEPFYTNAKKGWGVTDNDLKYVCSADSWPEVYRRLRERSHVIVDKSAYIFDRTPRYMQQLSEILAKVPDIPCIVMVKDFRAVACSSFIRSNMDMERWLKQRFDIAIRHALSYAQGYQKALACGLRDRLYLLQYENLYREPVKEAEKLFQFLDLSFDERLLKFASGRFKNVYGDRNSKDYLSEYSVQLPASVCQNILQKTASFADWNIAERVSSKLSTPNKQNSKDCGASAEALPSVALDVANRSAEQKTSVFRLKHGPQPKTVHNHAFHDARRMDPFFGYVDIQIKGCAPFLMFSNNDDLVAQSYFWYGDNGFEAETLAVWVELSKTARGAVVDVGAYTGIYSLAAYFANPKNVVFAFEPMRSQFGRMLLNFQVNRVGTIIHAENLAVSDSSGEAVMRQYRGHLVLGTGASLLDKKAKTVCFEEPVKTITMDDFFSGGKEVGLVKIDVEGAEELVLKGMGSILRRCRPTLIIEISSAELLESICTYLASFGYKGILIDDDMENLQEIDAVRFDKVRNYLFKFQQAQARESDAGADCDRGDIVVS